MKGIRRTLGTLFLVAALILTMIPLDFLNAAGRVEDFQMDNDDLVEYTGTASAVSVSDDVKNIRQGAFAGHEYIYKVDAGKNTKTIGDGAFSNCITLNSVNIQDNTKALGSAAFSGCRNLKSVTIGSALEELGFGVFAGCSKLEDVKFNKNGNFQVIGGGIYDNNVSMLYGYMSGHKSSLYRMPNTVERISKFAFWGNNIIDTVSLSNTLDVIPAYAFANCTNLKAINIPYSVNSIDTKSFENCISLYDVVIPASVSYIAPDAFDGCLHLNIIADPGTVAYDFFQKFKLNNDAEKTDAADVESLYNSIQQEITNPSGDNGNETDNNGVAVPNGEGAEYQESVTQNPDNGGYRYVDASRDPSNVDYMPTVDGLNNISGDGLLAKTYIVGGRAVLFVNPKVSVVNKITPAATPEVTNPELTGEDDNNSESDQSEPQNQTSSTDNPDSADGSEDPGDINVSASSKDNLLYDTVKGGMIPKYTEYEGKVASRAYYAAPDIDKADINSGITSIGDFAYARSNIKEAVIPEGVTSIGYGAFYHCDNLSKITIPSTVKHIAPYAFDKTAYMDEFNKGSNSFLIVGDGILVAYNGNSDSVSIPNSVKIIGPGAFKNHKEIINVLIPDSVTTIGEDSFNGCTSLVSVSGMDNVTSIEDRAFMGCPLASPHIPSSVESIGLLAFDYSNTGKVDSTKVVVFDGNKLPTIKPSDTAMRLDRPEYRKDSLYNVIFAVVRDNISDFKDTVLDDSLLGFSGLIVKLTKNESGAATGEASIVKSNIFSEEVLNKLPDQITVDGSIYTLTGKDSIEEGESSRIDSISSKDVRTLMDGEEEKKVSAHFSEDQKVGTLRIEQSETAASAISRVYEDIFGTKPDMIGLSITLKDETDSIPIHKLGKSKLSITIPLPSGMKDNIHVLTFDDDGQLEELQADVADGDVTFATSHLSYFGIFSSGSEGVGIAVKDGKLVKSNIKYDDSPDTGDHSLPIRLVLIFACVSIGLFILGFRGKRYAG